MTEPVLVNLAGLPGVGKTTLARALATNLKFVVLRVDCIEAPFIERNKSAGASGEGYEAIINLAHENLAVGNSVIIDTVNPWHLTRAMYVDFAKQSKHKFIQFELYLSDCDLHRERVERRQADIANFTVPNWSDVVAREYHEWNQSTDGPVIKIEMSDLNLALTTCIEAIAKLESDV